MNFAEQLTSTDLQDTVEESSNLATNPPLYQSLALKKEVQMWVNLYKVKHRDFEEKNPVFIKKLKLFTEKLRDKNTPVKKFDFNKTSIYHYLEEIF